MYASVLPLNKTIGEFTALMLFVSLIALVLLVTILTWWLTRD